MLKTKFQMDAADFREFEKEKFAILDGSLHSLGKKI